MENLVKVLGSMVLVGVLLFFGALLSTTIGAFTGWIVSLTSLGDWIKVVLGHPAYTLAQLGALLGFVGSFFRVAHSTSRK